ncbi:PP0621 family protein [Noviherbaspirillum denitrificans]|uniref:MYM-type domain-containing protein n=1 Tax=Noviherbaspirillum denitrificans TaxID=1968433 RepID=A0A254T8G5_9BURK|nr:PP0621 family protein [Noviherbaspirillum denitrificans]OWW18929.1 hypothetical protein AYR66_04950 [Noviherbaspirillum denitrificans]
MKVLLWVLIAIAVVIWLSYGKKQRVRAERTPAPSPSSPEAMVRCDHCGTYIPASEAVTTSSGKQFCSEEHRLLHATPGPSA